MAENVNAWEWTEVGLEAAEMLADGRLTSNEIAERVGVSQRTLMRWKLVPEFAAKVKEFADALEKVVLGEGIARRADRVRALDERRRLIHRVVAERGASPDMQTVPGGQTGLLVHTVKGVGKGEDFQLIDLYEVDVALLKELRETEKQAAQELGQWVQKVAPTTPDGAQPVSIFTIVAPPGADPNDLNRAATEDGQSGG